MTALVLTTLSECEQVIERGLHTFVEVGAALLTIRDERLYRAEHGTFDDYCRDRWQMSDRRARQLMDAAQIGTTVPIANEAQARELTGLTPQDQQAVHAAASLSTGGKPTASAIREARSELVGDRQPSRPTVVHSTTTTEKVVADLATGEVLTSEDWAAREQVTDFIESDQGVQQSRLAANYARLVYAASTGLPLLDAAAVAGVLDEDQFRDAELTRRRLNDWFDALSAARPRGLRAVKG